MRSLAYDTPLGRAACFRRGLLVLTYGERAVRFAPALTVRPDPAETAVAILADACADVARGTGT